MALALTNAGKTAMDGLVETAEGFGKLVSILGTYQSKGEGSGSGGGESSQEESNGQNENSDGQSGGGQSSNQQNGNQSGSQSSGGQSGQQNGNQSGSQSGSQSNSGQSDSQSNGNQSGSQSGSQSGNQSNGQLGNEQGDTGSKSDSNGSGSGSSESDRTPDSGLGENEDFKGKRAARTVGEDRARREREGGTGTNSSEQHGSGSSSSGGSDMSNLNNDAFTEGGVSDNAINDTRRNEVFDALAESDNDEYRHESVDVNITFNGKTLTGKVPFDIISNRKKDERDNKNSPYHPDSKHETDVILQRIDTKKKIDIQRSEANFSMTSTNEMLDRNMKFAQIATRNWQGLLRNLCNAKRQKKYTYTSPNEDYVSMGITLPTRQRIGRNTQVKHIKFAVDVSGSVGDAELRVVFSQIKQILDQCDVDAELIYWDTHVCNVGDFDDLKSLIKITPKGGGGTNPCSVFEYLMGNATCNGKKEKSSLKEISAVIFFTDGYFSKEYAKYARWFGSKTYWIIDDAAAAFDAEFGKIALARLSSEDLIDTKNV